jgi:hypothetical protein
MRGMISGGWMVDHCLAFAHVDATPTPHAWMRRIIRHQMSIREAAYLERARAYMHG